MFVFVIKWLLQIFFSFASYWSYSELNFVGCVWLWCSGYSLLRYPQYNKGFTNALVIQLIPCCQSVLAVMLAKKRERERESVITIRNDAVASTLRSKGKIATTKFNIVFSFCFPSYLICCFWRVIEIVELWNLKVYNY